MGNMPDPDRVRRVADGLSEAHSEWETLMKRMLLSGDFQSREYYKMTQVHLKTQGQSFEAIGMAMRWQVDTMRAFADGRPPPNPPVGLELEAMAKQAQQGSGMARRWAARDQHRRSTRARDSPVVRGGAAVRPDGLVRMGASYAASIRLASSPSLTRLRQWRHAGTAVRVRSVGVRCPWRARSATRPRPFIRRPSRVPCPWRTSMLTPSGGATLPRQRGPRRPSSGLLGSAHKEMRGRRGGEARPRKSPVHSQFLAREVWFEHHSCGTSVAKRNGKCMSILGACCDFDEGFVRGLVDRVARRCPGRGLSVRLMPICQRR